MQPQGSLYRFTVILISALSVFTLGIAGTEKSDLVRSRALFLQAAKVFMHPRCLNCHPGGDRPTQGMDLHPHAMNVERGAGDHGAVALSCNSCHGVVNNVHSGVPGAPKWGVAPKDMAWQGLKPKELCETIKSTMRKHQMSDQAFISHNSEDPLVGWAWHPGGDLTPVPGTQAAFGRIVREWLETGAECPTN